MISRAVLVTAIAAGGCSGSCGLDLERMGDQPRYTTYEACSVCPEGTIMMTPPRGVVHRATEPAAPAGDPAEIPITVDAELIARGRDRFNIYCATCHGRLANGISQVAENMRLRPPPNLLAPPYSTRTPAHLFAVVTDGYGLMRSYAPELTRRDRWSVIAYLQVLQLAQHVALNDLSESQREEARRWLK